MTGYQNKVIHLAGDKQKGEVQLVVNLFQSVLDGFIRGEMKKEEAEPAKVKDSLWLCRISPSVKPTCVSVLMLSVWFSAR